MSGRIFIGPELCHEETYITASINYTIDVMRARQAIQNLSPWQRWFKAASLPEVKSLDKHEQTASRFLHPIVTARRQAEKEPSGYEKPDDMLQWMMDAQGMREREDRELAKIQLALSFAAIHTTTMTATNA